MIKEIKYGGVSAIPSDYDVADGEMSYALNIINEDGALKTIPAPEIKVSAPTSGGEFLYIHKTSEYTHYIYYDNVSKKIGYIDADKKLDSGLEFTHIPIQITSVGNTLLVLTEEGMFYLLWKSEDNNYINLGNHLPECPISFGLDAQVKDGTISNIEYAAGENDAETNNNFKYAIQNNSDIILGKVNKFIAEKTKEGFFLFPFFVRYAYRLYDGSLTMHSAPILMACSSGITPNVISRYRDASSETNGEADSYRENLSLLGVWHSLDYISNGGDDLFNDWEDIIKSVDIFISSPIYTYDQNGKCETFNILNDNNTYGINRAYYETGGTSSIYGKNYHKDILSFRANINPYCNEITLPSRKQEDIQEDIENTSLFYLLKSIAVKKLSTNERTIINIEENYLTNLVQKEVMTDDYDSHDTLIPKVAFPYNSRINIANIKKELYKGGLASSLFCYSEAEKTEVKIFFEIKENGKVIRVADEKNGFDHNNPYLYIYYPNINAYKAVIYFQNDVDVFGNAVEFCEISLKPHPMLNGAYAFVGWDGTTFTATETELSVSDDRTIALPNKIYSSEVNNPFIFPVTGINTIGTGEIIAMATSTKALSEGQFGQFPLYVFSEEGIWAMEVSSTGGYTVKQPITRDVCNNPKSVTSLDNAVAFTTDRGIMLLQGSQTQCISDVINNPNPLGLKNETLPSIESLLYIWETDNNISTLSELYTKLPFKTFLQNAQMLYDYQNQRLIVFSEDVIAYVYSLKTNTWGMIKCNIKHSLNSYPQTLAVDNQSNIISFSEITSSDTSTPFFIITRPFKLDMPDIHKTITTLIQRGMLSNIKQALYGRNDLHSGNWVIVSSSSNNEIRGIRGTPFKYYCMIVFGKMNNTEDLSRVTIEFVPKLTNRLR